MKKMTKFFALALLAGAMVSCNTEDTALRRGACTHFRKSCFQSFHVLIFITIIATYILNCCFKKGLLLISSTISCSECMPSQNTSVCEPPRSSSTENGTA